MLTGALCDDLLYFRRPTVDTADNHVSTSAQRGSANDSDPKEAAVIYRSSGSGLTGDRAIVYINVANPIPQSITSPCVILTASILSPLSNTVFLFRQSLCDPYVIRTAFILPRPSPSSLFAQALTSSAFDNVTD